MRGARQGRHPRPLPSLTAGKLGSRRHINLPGVDVNLPSLTEKDERDIRVGVEAGVDFIALSFVRRAKTSSPCAVANLARVQGAHYCQNRRSGAACGIWKRSSKHPTPSWLPAATWGSRSTITFSRWCRPASWKSAWPREARHYRHAVARIDDLFADADPARKSPMSPTPCASGRTPSCSQGKRPPAYIRWNAST